VTTQQFTGLWFDPGTLLALASRHSRCTSIAVGRVCHVVTQVCGKL